MIKRSTYLVVLSLVISFEANSAPAPYIPNVKWAGFAMAGKFADLPTNYKHTKGVIDSTKDADGRSIFDKEFLKLFKENVGLINKIKLTFGEDTDTKVALAVALTRENISTVTIEGLSKVIVNLSVNVLLLDFEELKVKGSFPIYLEYIDIRKELPTDEYFRDLITKLFFQNDSSILQILKKKLSDVYLSANARLSLRIYNLNFDDQVMDFLKTSNIEPLAFKGALAQRFSDILSTKLAVPVLPYAKDYLNGRMSLVFSDARVQDFAIPESSYSLDIQINKFTKELYKKGIGEDGYLYGIYGDTKVNDPDLGTVYFNEKIKYGAVKVVPNAQTEIDEFAAYDDMMDLFMKEIISKMQKNKSFNKEVIQRCSRK